MCPHCSTLACKKGLEKWLNRKSQCPKCRHSLSNRQVVKVRHLDGAYQASSMQLGRLLQDLCQKSGHTRQLEYYCEEPCMEIFCLDCMVLDQKHLGAGHKRISLIERHKQMKASLHEKVQTEFGDVIKQLKGQGNLAKSQITFLERE